jgi:hypothetical protein
MRVLIPRPLSQAEIDAQLDPLRKLDYPTTIEGWVERSASDDDGGARIALAQVLEDIDTGEVSPHGQDLLHYLGRNGDGKPLPEDFGASIRTAAEANADVTTEVLKSVAQGLAPVPLALGQMPYRLESDTLHDALFAARLLQVAALDAAHRGDADLTLECLFGIVAVADTWHEHPLLISQVVRLAALKNAVDRVADVLPEADFSEDALVSLSNRLEGIVVRDPMARALAYEFLHQRQFLWVEVMPSENFGPVERFLKGAGEMTGYFDREAGKMSAIYAVLLDAYHQPWSSILPAIQQLELRAEQGDDAWLPSICEVPIPTLYRNGVEVLQFEFSRRAALSVVAIERYRTANGSLPETLGALVPDYLDAVHTDPVHGGPLMLVASGGGYRIHAPGLDGADNGGLQDGDGPGEDWVYRVRTGH